MKIFSLYTISLVLFLSFMMGCEDVIEINVPDEEPRLVVEGSITTLPGPQTVKLTYSTQYFETTTPPPVTDAQVILRDDQGREDQLVMIDSLPGVYYTHTPGEIGRAYTLDIILPDGRQYRSDSEVLSKVSDITALNYDIADQDEEPQEDGRRRYTLLLSAIEPQDERNFYRWKVFINDKLVGDPEDLAFARDDFVGEFVIDVEIYEGRMTPGDRVRVQQLSITESYYDFLAVLFEQTAFIGGLFDPPPAPIRGNIRNVDDPNDYGLGYFNASDVDVAEIVIEREEE